MFGAGVPGAGLTVHTGLANPSTRPGLRLPGRVTLTAGHRDVPIGHVVLGLVTRVEPASPDEPRVLVEFARTPATGAFLLGAGERRTIGFAAPLPWETPITVINGQALLNLAVGLRTEVAVGRELDRGDLHGIYVHPLPVQERILAAFATLGFALRQAGMQAGRLPGVRQSLPFHQKIGFWAAPLYAGPIGEVEVTFLADAEGVEVILWLDRRLALAGAGHFSISRFRVGHDRAVGAAGEDEAAWIGLVDGWLRDALRRHAVAASGQGLPVTPPPPMAGRPVHHPEPLPHHHHHDTPSGGKSGDAGRSPSGGTGGSGSGDGT